jgi:hypothetical protein
MLGDTGNDTSYNIGHRHERFHSDRQLETRAPIPDWFSGSFDMESILATAMACLPICWQVVPGLFWTAQHFWTCPGVCPKVHTSSA